MRRISVGLVVVVGSGLLLFGLARSRGASGPVTVFVPSGSPPPAGVFIPYLPGESPADAGVMAAPLGSAGTEVASIDNANLAVPVHVPVNLPAPASTWTNTSPGNPAGQEVAWVYNDPSVGRFDIMESVAYEDQAELEAPAHAKPGCTVSVDSEGNSSGSCNPGGFSMVTLDNGIRALLYQGHALESIHWIEQIKDAPKGLDPGTVLEVAIIFPDPKSMSAQDLVSIANRV